MRKTKRNSLVRAMMARHPRANRMKSRREKRANNMKRSWKGEV